jgi:hypothetical protein
MSADRHRAQQCRLSVRQEGRQAGRAKHRQVRGRPCVILKHALLAEKEVTSAMSNRVGSVWLCGVIGISEHCFVSYHLAGLQ